MNRLFLIDAYAMIYRAYYSFINNPMMNSKGENTSAILGFVNSLAEILKKENPTHIAVVFDPPNLTFRNTLSPEYKAQRPPTPEGIKTAIPWIKKILDAFGIKQITVDNYEADDAIGTLAKKAEKQGFDVYMVTPDKDYNQLLSDHIWVYKPKKSNSEVEIINEKEFIKQSGLDSALQFIEILALWGDASDNVKGVNGVGEKTAYKLISQYKSIEGIYENINQLKGKQKENFIACKDIVALAKQLVTIVIDAPVDFIEEDFKKKDTQETILRDIFTELEFKNLADRILGKTSNNSEPKKQMPAFEQGTLFFDGVITTPNEPIKFENIKTVNHEYKVLTTDEEITELSNNLQKLKEFCFDTETNSLTIHEAKLVGMSFSWEIHKAIYIPFDINNQERTFQIINILKPAFENPNSLKIGQNIKFDIHVLKNYGVEVEGNLFDTMVAHYMLQPEQRHNMDYLSEVYLKYTPVHIEELIGEKGKTQINMSQVDISKIKEYAGEDADVTYQLKQALYSELEKNNILKPALEIEMPLIHVLADMEYTGVCIDTEFLKSYTQELNKEISKKEEEIYGYANKKFNIASSKQLGTILFDELKIDSAPKKTKTGQYATGEEELIKLKDKHKIIEAILDYRGLKKLVSTYTEALPLLINSKTGRIHTNFNQTITATGRLSSTNPNIQNIPIRTEEGRKIREAFIASSKENLIYSADYSQVELRVMAHLSNDENMISAFKADQDIHRATASLIFGVKPEEITREQRSNAKSANFGIIYGISAFGLSNNTGLSRTEAKQIIDNYFIKYPDIKKYIDNSIAEARNKGYVTTMFQRRRYLPDINSRNPNVRTQAERNAVNTPIQGTASEIIKIAMIDVFNKFKEEKLKSKLIIQVHDELVFDVFPEEKEKVEQIVTSSMENAVNLSIKLKVEGNFGKNWLEAH
ncbi:MAG: DNA polymerase I [Bacteroidales bacterium]|nr:DNA polymerase I [Bacteroidales bacterium]